MGSLEQCEKINLSASELPSFIYNRFDLWNNIDQKDVCFWAYRRKHDLPTIVFESFEKGKSLYLGIWLVPITKGDLEDIVQKLFEKRSHVLSIEYINAVVPVGDWFMHNHVKIELPHLAEELDERLSRKGRYNIRREQRLLKENVGDFSFCEYRAGDDAFSDVLEKYFEMKKVTHGVEYGLTPLQYISKYHVTHAYLLELDSSGQILSIALSCEECRIVYLENISYDVEFARYSPGQILYDIYLKRLCEKNISMLYLQGGDYFYKKRYGSIDESVYSGICYRNLCVRLLLKLRRCIKKQFKRVGRQWKSWSKKMDQEEQADV